MSWQGGNWRGGYWHGARRSPKQRPAKKDKDTGKKEQQQEAAIPGYDSTLWSSSASSSRPAPTQPGVAELTRVLKTIVDAGQINLPPEAVQLLATQETVEIREEMQKEQKTLNMRRKAHNKVLRLKEALDGKHRKFQAFKQALKEQLVSETERYEKDVKELTVTIEEAEKVVAQIDKGELPVNKDKMETETVEIEDLLDDEGREKARLHAQILDSEKGKQEAEEKFIAVQQQLFAMQYQYQALAQTLSAPLGSQGPQAIPSLVPSEELPASPQMPKPKSGMTEAAGMDGRPPIAPFSRASQSRSRDGPYTESKAPCRSEVNMDGMDT